MSNNLERYYFDFDNESNLDKLLDIIRVPSEKEKYCLTTKKQNKVDKIIINCQLDYNNPLKQCFFNFILWKKNYGLEIEIKSGKFPDYFVNKLNTNIHNFL